MKRSISLKWYEGYFMIYRFDAKLSLLARLAHWLRLISFSLRTPKHCFKLFGESRVYKSICTICFTSLLWSHVTSETMRAMSAKYMILGGNQYQSNCLGNKIYNRLELAILNVSASRSIPSTNSSSSCHAQHNRAPLT